MGDLTSRRHHQARIAQKIAAAPEQGRRPRLVRKQISDQRDWERVWDTIDSAISKDKIDELVGLTVAECSNVLLDLREQHWTNDLPRAAYGWSGGKDSLALEIVMDELGVKDCVFVITNLEYPAFLQWATDNMPDGCEVVNVGLDLKWLIDHPDMLFPPDAKASAKWFSAVQHTGQKQYYDSHGLDVMFLGRRRADGNNVGRNGWTRSRRGTFYNPIRGWTHEHVLALLKHRGVELPPMYAWPRGYQVGTGPWPARQFCATIDQGLEEVWSIDPSILRGAKALPVIADWMRRNGYL